MPKSRGFTLLELLITVMIAGILASMAFPAYLDHTRRANRTVAKAVLSEAAARQESWFTDRKTYSNTLGSDGLNYVANVGATSFYIDQSGKPGPIGGAIYNVSIVAYSATAAPNCSGSSAPAAPTASVPLTSWTLVATPVNSQVKDSTCKKVCLSHDGTRGVEGPAGMDCWAR
jgi:type IV pilus assembly protein PilE